VDELLKIVVVTRGRTGSTAIVEELGQAPGCRAEQEVFSRGLDAPFYETPLFEVWRDGRAGVDEQALAEAYLDELEDLARERGATALFWKALSNHFDERPYLGDMLRRRGYRAILLRRAPVRQVISGLVAQRRGLYNSRKPVEEHRTFTIDPAELRGLAGHEQFATSRDEALLFRLKLNAIEADYEAYLADRAAFFARIFAALGLPEALPAPSDYVVMLPDLKAVIENYDEIRSVAAEFGESL
jgi:hypothetical protein